MLAVTHCLGAETVGFFWERETTAPPSRDRGTRRRLQTSIGRLGGRTLEA